MSIKSALKQLNALCDGCLIKAALAKLFTFRNKKAYTGCDR